MIPIIFEKGEKDFRTNGIGRLSDSIRCNVTEERNGIYELELEYPVAGRYYKELSMSKVILAKPNEMSDNQPFRIYKISKPLNGKVTVYAEHISYQLNFIPVAPFNANSASDAMGGMESYAAENNPFTFWTDLGGTGGFRVEEPASIRSKLGGVKGSVLDVYGGEYEFDMYEVKLHAKRGRDEGVTIRYGKNMTDLKQEESIENTITGIYPYYKNTDGELVVLPEKIISSENEKNYPFPRTVPVDLSSEFKEKPTEDALRKEAESYIKKNGIGVPAVSLTVSFTQLWQSEEYKERAPISRVGLCDYVTVIFEELGVNKKAKVVKTVYDVLLEKYKSVELGETRSSLADTITKQQQNIEERPTSSILNQYIDSATDLITGNKGGYIVFRLNEEGKPYEFLIMDAPDINSAKKVWRWNSAGLGHSNTGYNGPYPVAITQDGKIVADFIATGTMYADRIKGGTLTLGGYNNQNGKMVMQDAAGKRVGIWDNEGITTTGPIKSNNTSDKRAISINNGCLYIYGDEGKVTGTISFVNGGITIDNTGDKTARITLAQNGTAMFVNRNGRGDMVIGGGDSLSLSAKEIMISGGMTGRAEFSDGSYLEFKSGILTGGKTAGGDLF